MEEDAYCLAMAFGSSVSADNHNHFGRVGREGASSARKTIERRLEMLVSRINAAGSVDGSAAGPNVDGARPYLSSLLADPTPRSGRLVEAVDQRVAGGAEKRT